jgi:hypothetical protein
MDCGGEHCYQRAGGGHVMVTCHVVSRFDRTTAEQHRQQHQPAPCADAIRNEQTVKSRKPTCMRTHREC